MNHFIIKLIYSFKFYLSKIEMKYIKKKINRCNLISNNNRKNFDEKFSFAYY